MTESGNPGAPFARPPQGIDPAAMVDALRARGAERFDPVGFRFVEALARRAAAHPGGSSDVLERRLARALAEFGERFDRAERRGRATLARATLRFPGSADPLRRLCDAGDFGELNRRVARLEGPRDSSPLAELLAHIARHAPQDATIRASAVAGSAVEPQRELKSLQYFRSTWSKLSVGRKLSQAFAQAPENAGPLNSHFLVLQSLRLMRDVSPEYLEHFISYVDALLWLDQGESDRKPARKAALRGERDRRRKPGRGS